MNSVRVYTSTVKKEQGRLATGVTKNKFLLAVGFATLSTVVPVVVQPISEPVSSFVLNLQLNNETRVDEFKLNSVFPTTTKVVKTSSWLETIKDVASTISNA